MYVFAVSCCNSNLGSTLTKTIHLRMGSLRNRPTSIVASINLQFRLDKNMY